MFDDDGQVVTIPVSVGGTKNGVFNFDDLVICMEETTHIPAHSRTIVPGVVRRRVSDDAVLDVDMSELLAPVNILVEGNKKLDGLLASRSINVLDSSGRVAVMMLKVTNEPIILNRRRIIASLSLLEN